MVILAHGFGGFSPWPVGPIAFGYVAREEHHDECEWQGRQKKEKERDWGPHIPFPMHPDGLASSHQEEGSMLISWQ
jgi:hypothetical protein